MSKDAELLKQLKVVASESEVKEEVIIPSIGSVAKRREKKRKQKARRKRR